MDYSILLQVSESAGIDRDRMIALINELIEAVSDSREIVEDGEIVNPHPIYNYAHMNKIHRQYVMEITGVWRDPNPRPVIPEDLRDALEYYLTVQRENKR